MTSEITSVPAPSLAPEAGGGAPQFADAGGGSPAVQSPPPLDHGPVRTIVAGIMLAMFLSALEQTIVAPALPAIGKSLGGIDDLSWVVTAYLLAVTATTPLFGKLSDIYGRRLILMWAIGIFVAGSVACALAQKACRDGYSSLYTRAVALFRDLAMARADGSLRSLLTRLSRIDVLVIDDWAMAPLSETERRDFWEICEDRYQTRSTILTSQLPVARWHEQIGDPTAADGILDRLVHNAHRIEMRGDSMRKKRGGAS